MILDRIHLFCIRKKRVKGDFEYFISLLFTEKQTESSARRGQPLKENPGFIPDSNITANIGPGIACKSMPSP